VFNAMTHEQRLASPAETVLTNFKVWPAFGPAILGDKPRWFYVLWL